MNWTTVSGVPSTPISRTRVQIEDQDERPEERLERAEAAPDQPAERRAALDGLAAEHGAGARGVVVGGQDHDAGLVAAASFEVTFCDARLPVSRRTM